MSVMQILFLIVSAVGLLTALGTVLARNLVHAALFLIGFFFAVACQFVLLEAEFLAAMQVLVYIGAVSILILFGIMLTRNVQGDETTGGHWLWKVPAAVVAAGVLAVLAFGIARESGRPGQVAWTRVTTRPGGVNPSLDGPATASVAFNSTGQYVATAGSDRRVRLWSPVAGLATSAWHFPEADAEVVAFSPEGNVVAAAGSDGSARLWLYGQRREAPRLLPDRPYTPTSIALGRRLDSEDPLDRPVAVGCDDGDVRLWRQGELVRVEAHKGRVEALCFGPDNKTLVTVGADRSVSVWDLVAATGRELLTAERGRPTRVVTVGQAAVAQGEVKGGPLVAVAELVDGRPGRWSLRVLDAASGEELGRRDDLTGLPEAVALGSDGRGVAVAVGPIPAEDADEAGPATLYAWTFDPTPPPAAIEGGGGPYAPPPGTAPTLPPDEEPVEPVAHEMATEVAGATLLALGPRARRAALAHPGGTVRFFDLKDDTWTTGNDARVTTTAAVVSNMPRAVGDELMTRYVLPFEVAGLLLTAALVGAIVLARQDARPAPSMPPAVAARLESGRPIAPSAVDAGAAATAGNGQGLRHAPNDPESRTS